ncbi:MAG: IgGFc-binding protein [Archangium sp.]|nr:IgGFc-binding protein [Archangium sp.]MDP3154788.1 IgGFc-binding protein [Archangium sp.]MDP3575076.1 IgGFc-binding protein [Archangium sp.]
MRALPLVIALCLATGCEPVVRTKPQVDAGPICEGAERLVNGACRFVCTRDGDCPTGQRCDLLIGTCAPRPAPVDAGETRIPCTEGAVRCSADNTAVQTCGDAGVFATSQQCVQPDGFCQNERCLVCRPGAKRCAGSGTEICRDDGSGYRAVTCAVGASCVAGECVECTVGQRRCSPDNTTLEECQRLPREDLSAGYVAAGDNFDGTCVTQVCEQGASGPQCRAPACLPGALRCGSPTNQEVCSPTGAWSSVACSSLPNMGPTAECLNGACVDECADAVRARSYFGCEYWSAITDNSVDALFKGRTLSGQGTADSDFVFVVTNQSAVPATVEVWRYVGTAPVRVKQVTVPGRNDPATRGLVKIPVPWQSIGPANAQTGNALTGRARYGYRLTSTRPVTVYQFNPIDAVKVTNKACTASVGSSDCDCNEYSEFVCTTTFFGTCIACNSPGICSQAGAGKRCSYGTFSNDASLLLPAHILGLSYVAVTPGHSHINDPSAPAGQRDLPRSSAMTIVATADNTAVTVKAAGVTQASTSGTAVAAMAVGETRVFTLQSYEVLQLSSATAGANLTPDCQNFSGGATWCRKANDLTGSIITSDKPVALFGSNPCLNVPWTRAACDHVEEQVFPFNTWGQNFVAVPSAPLRLINNNFSTNPPPDHFKIVAGAPTTLILTPPPAAADVLVPLNCLSGSLQANTCQLAGGSFVEFKSVRPFTVRASAPIAVAQFFPGQGNVSGAPTDPQQGDPSMVLLPPVEQWRSRYTVLASTGLKDNYLGLTIDGTKVMNVKVDGVIVTGFATIAGTSFQTRNHPVTTGTHTIEVTPLAGQLTLPGAGVTVYGYDAYVSYGYTGGLDLTTIVTGINPGG